MVMVSLLTRSPRRPHYINPNPNFKIKISIIFEPSVRCRHLYLAIVDPGEVDGDPCL
jgi:hypothetical protein